MAKKSLIKHYRTFYIECYAVRHDKKKPKFTPRVSNCIYLGRSDERDGYQLWHIATKSIINSRDVVFKKEILKVSNKYASAPSTSYVKKDTLFIENSSDDDSDNERKRDDILPNLTESNETTILGHSLRIAPTSQNGQVLPHESHCRRVVLW
jgi:hypothetical protein